MVYFVGAGPGAEDLITVRGMELLKKADVIIYAGSLVNPKLLEYADKTCIIHNSAYMTLEEVIGVTAEAEKEGKTTVRLHTGDPCLYGAIREQMEELSKKKIPYEVCPGVSSFCGAAASLQAEYTLPGVSQSVVITRMAGRTPVPQRESIVSFAAHKATMVIFLSTGMLGQLSRELIQGGYEKDQSAAIVYKATWPEERILRCTVGTLEETAKREGIYKTALIIVGDILNGLKEYSRLYAPEFTTEYRKGRSPS
ncbi:MAG: precorrin-4 C(11)-methyltransferase [Clostridiales bacterium]|nr:precorrin-4 C(11)-methyltransferase [Clostridiales bacterium]